MMKKLILSAGMMITAFALSSAGALAYTGSAGASLTAIPTTVAPGGQVTLTATFTTPGAPGNSVTFSFTKGGTGCTVTFSTVTGTTDANGVITSVATIGSACSGVVDFTATNNTSGQVVTTSITVSGGLPNASAETPAGQSVPVAPLAGLVASFALIVLAGALYFRRRS